MSAFSAWLNSRTADASPDASADYLVSYDASAATSKKVLLSVLLALASASGIPTDGWVAAEAWTYVSADGPTGVFSVASDVTGKYQAGMRVKYTQTTVKYGIITTTGSFGGGVTNITIYGGTDYVLSNAAISANFYSIAKTPFGFNTSPAKWTEEYNDTSLRTQASPASGTWYNINSASVSLPIGVWNVSYQAVIYVDRAANGFVTVYGTLSTANNSQSDADWTTILFTNNSAGLEISVTRQKLITVAAKTSYFFNTKTGTASMTNIYNDGASSPTIVRAVCALL